MRENFEKMKFEIKEVEKLCKKAFFETDALKDMSADEFEVLKHMLHLVDDSMNFMEAQVSCMERLEEKLDKLLSMHE